MSVNRKLFTDNNSLLKRLEAKDSELLELRDHLDELLIQKNTLLEEKSSLERTVSSLNETRTVQKTEINKLVEDNQKLMRLSSESEKTIKLLEVEKIKLISKNEELQFDLKNLNGKLKSKEENLNYLHKQLEETKSANVKYQNMLKDYENQIDLLRNDIANLNTNLNGERAARAEAEKAGDKLRATLNERDREIGRFVNELDETRRNFSKTADDKFILESENEKLKNHIFVLSEQNDKVILFLINFST